MWGLAGKENIWDLLDVGIGEALMQGCSDVHIIGEFASFLMSHFMQLFGDSFEAGDLYKRFARGGIVLCQWLLLVLQRGGLVRCCLELDLCGCCMDEAYKEG